MKPDDQTARRASSYFELEEPIRHLVHMAHMACSYVCGQSVQPDRAAEERREADRVAVAVSTVADMAESLRKAH